jgi:hypothetical protein
LWICVRLTIFSKMISKSIDWATNHLYTRTTPKNDGREGCIRKKTQIPHQIDMTLDKSHSSAYKPDL